MHSSLLLVCLIRYSPGARIENLYLASCLLPCGQSPCLPADLPPALLFPLSGSCNPIFVSRPQSGRATYFLPELGEDQAEADHAGRMRAFESRPSPPDSADLRLSRS
jgi:hypothetical protein